ncbi:TonB-dependent siderophore receptor [Alcaligenaceae bacterium SJ-26]|nr:TonB-dependent siderophore receptor [Alcaligenaceae bacterium SJ-26]
MRAVSGAGLRPLTLSVLLALGVPSVFHADPARAASVVQRYDVPAGPLDVALTTIARRGGAVASFDPALTAGRTAQAVSGELDVRDALRRALEGTGLELVEAGDGTLLVRPAPAPGVQALDAVTIRGQSDGKTEGTGAYTTGSMSTATGLALSMRETPQSTTVVTHQQIEDRAMTSIVDVVRDAPGLFLSNVEGPGRPTFLARGFNIDTLMFDGLTVGYDYFSAGTQTNLAMYDRVEIVRGATGLVQGSGNPSAAINLVRKRPTADARASLTGRAGSWDDYTGEADVSGPLNGSGSLRGRAVASWQDAHGFRDSEKQDHGLFYAVVEADLSERTLLTAGFSYQKDQTNNFWGGLPLTMDGGHMNVRRSTLPGNDWENLDVRGRMLFGELSHSFDNGWTAGFKAMRSSTDIDFLGSYLRRVGTETRMRHYAYRGEYELVQTSYELQASGPFRLMQRDHELTVGVNRRKRDYIEHDYGGGYVGDGIEDLSGWDPGSLTKPSFSYAGTRQTVTSEDGVYAAARLSLADPLSLILGARLDWYDYDNRSGTDGYSVTRNLTRYGGLIYDLDARHSLYVSFTDIFQPQNAKGTDGAIIEPIVGENYEIGIKGEYFDGALNASLALFQVDQKNRARDLDDQTQCPTYPYPYCAEASGLVRSRGVDIEVQGALTSNWQVSAGYTYTHAEYRRDADPGKVGQPFNSATPEHLFKLSTLYHLQGEWQRWRVGGSLYWQSRIYRDGTYNGTAFRSAQGAYAIADLVLGYRASRQLDLQLNINNLLDRKYYKSVGYDVMWGPQDIYGDPRNFMLTARYTF